jgi:hypothetical protein
MAVIKALFALRRFKMGRHAACVCIVWHLKSIYNALLETLRLTGLLNLSNRCESPESYYKLCKLH